jgi:hypothetical protein
VLSADVLARFLVPDVGERIHTYISIPPTIAEIWMVGYLLIKGVNVSRPADRAPFEAELAPMPA